MSDDRLQRLIEQRESFWTAVYPLYMRCEITPSNLGDLVGRGLQQSRGRSRGFR